MEFTIYPPNSPVAGMFFGIPIRFYGLIMMFSFVVGVVGVFFLFKIKKLYSDAEIFLDYSPLVIFFSILGARFFYVLGSFSYYFANPAEIIMINHGGLSIFGAILFGLLSIFLFSRLKKFSFSKHCDVIAVIFPFCQAIGRLGNYFNQEAFGAPTNGFLRLFVDIPYRPKDLLANQFYHPAFLYEMILDFFVFIILFIIFFKYKNLKTGTIALLYLIFYSVIRFIIELIRIDSVMFIKTLPIACAISLVLFLISIAILCLMYKKKV